MMIGVLAGLALGLAICSVAGAQETNEEDAFIRRGLQLRKQGNDRAALLELQRAYEVGRSPRAAAQLGFAEQALGMWPQAEAHVGEALRARDDHWVRKNRVTVEQALATIRAHVGRVEIVGGEPGAQVTVNGQAAGALPLADAIAVSAGPVEIEVRAAGFAPSVKTVNVAVGEYARVPFTLQPRAVQARVPQPPPRAVAPVQPVPGALAQMPAAAPTGDRDDGRGRRYAGIGLVAGGLAAVGGGVAASLTAKNKFDAINADAAADRAYNPGNGNWKTYETAATVLYVVGAGALIGGSVLYVSGRSRGESAGAANAGGVSVSLKPQLGPGRAGATVAVRF
jgi:hypothetical protein